VVDEAHGFTIAVDAKGLISKKSDRYKAAEAVARRSHRLILMTATPHSGRDYSLWALLRLMELTARLLPAPELARCCRCRPSFKALSYVG
jgi:hypothetical protein